MRTLIALSLLIASCQPLATNDAARTCPGVEPLLVEHAPKGGWDVAKMSRYAYRESRCTPNARSRTRDSGLLQINDVNLAYLSQKFGRKITAVDLYDPTTNVRAAAMLCEFWRNAGRSCYRPWAT